MLNREDVQSADILLVDDLPDNLNVLSELLKKHGHAVRTAINGALALRTIAVDPPDLILLDVMMPDPDGFEVCRRLKANPDTADIPVMFITALNELNDKVAGLRLGAVDYITKPFQAEEVLVRVNTHLMLLHLRRRVQDAHDALEVRVRERTAELLAAQHTLEQEVEQHKDTARRLRLALSEVEALQERLKQENVYLQEEIREEHNIAGILGHSTALAKALKKVENVAATDTTVLILGETGTGKELFARAIHHAGPRRDRALVKVNCAALPASLIESELFGHEKGAFSGAHATRIGRFELANQGTIFLDEIGELPLELQAKLLRVLQEGEFERLGCSVTRKTDARVLAVTNRNLIDEIEYGRFREDLYYRLNVYTITVPPLRERRDDIAILAASLIKRYNKKLGKHVERIPQHTLDALLDYDWPGNIRELENVIERAVINSRNGGVWVELPPTPARTRPPIPGFPVSVTEVKTLKEMERNHILHVLTFTDWRIAGPGGAASVLDINPSTLRSRIKKLNIHNV